MARRRICGIYKITNIVNGKIYIGQSVNIKSRWNNHKNDLRKNKHYNSHLQNAWNKYGEESFVFEVVEECDVSEGTQLDTREQYWMDLTKCYEGEIGYNESRTAHGITISAEKLEERTAKQKGEKNPRSKIKQETVDNIRKDYSTGLYSQSELAIKYNLKRSKISSITQNKIWIDKNYIPYFAEKEEIKIKQTKARKDKKYSFMILTKENADDIRKEYDEGNISQKKLAIKYGVKRTTIAMIIKNINWYDPNYFYKEKSKDDLLQLQRKNFLTGEQHPGYGKKQTLETIQKRRDSMLGHETKPETRQKISESQKGEKSHKAVLTQTQVDDLRKRWLSNEDTTIIKLAKEYNVTRGCMSGVIKNINWYDPNYTYVPKPVNYSKKQKNMKIIDNNFNKFQYCDYL